MPEASGLRPEPKTSEARGQRPEAKVKANEQVLNLHPRARGDTGVFGLGPWGTGERGERPEARGQGKPGQGPEARGQRPEARDQRPEARGGDCDLGPKCTRGLEGSSRLVLTPSPSVQIQQAIL